MIRTWRVRINNRFTLTITGRRNAIMDMCYDNGAMAVTIIEDKS